MNIEFIEGGNIKQYEKEIDSEMDKHLKHFEKDLQKLRTGRAHPSMVEDIRATAYGAIMPLRELAAISVQEASLIVIQPWDKANLGEIEKALSKSDLGITPQNDGELIRIKIPPMSSSRRDELIKTLGQKTEACKVAIRNERKDILNKIRENEKSKKVSEDFSKRLQDMLQKNTDKFIKAIDQITVSKESEIKNL